MRPPNWGDISDEEMGGQDAWDMHGICTCLPDIWALAPLRTRGEALLMQWVKLLTTASENRGI